MRIAYHMDELVGEQDAIPSVAKFGMEEEDREPENYFRDAKTQVQANCLCCAW